MRAIVNNRLILILILVMICFICKSQTKAKSQVTPIATNTITLKFPNYTYEMDCKVMEIMNQITDAKVVFTCVQAGILVIESKNMVGVNLREKLNDKILERNESINFELIELVTSTAKNNSYFKYTN